MNTFGLVRKNPRASAFVASLAHKGAFAPMLPLIECCVKLISASIGGW